VSDSSQGPGWWQASDGKWYPPEQQPGAQAGGGGSAGTPGTLDIGAALTYGWNKFVQYIGQIILIILIIFGVQIAFNIIGNIISGGIGGFTGLFLSLVFSVAGLMISFILQAGLIRVGLAVTRGEEPEPSMLFQTDNIAPFAIASILVGLLIIVGLFACCIGALVVMLFTLFYGYYVIDKSQGPTESIMSSFNLVKNNAGSVIGFAIVVVVLNLITCGLAIGITQIAVAYAYKTLNGEPVSQ
jgi:hypothetical protein